MTHILFILLYVLHLTPFLAPDSTNTGTAVIVCPGGSYTWIPTQEEGTDVCEWLQGEGINAYLLQYRTPTFTTVSGLRMLGCGYHWPAPLVDVEQALQYVYEHAQQDRVDTAYIGVIGFSAGGHLAMSSYLYNTTPYKPHFMGSIYPVVTLSDEELSHRRSRRGVFGWWGQFSKSKQDSLSLEKHVLSSCPPVFLANCKDDPIVKYQNSELLDSALTAKGVEHTYIQYQTGGHGFGASEKKGTEECRQWKNEFILWISNLKAQSR